MKSCLYCGVVDCCETFNNAPKTCKNYMRRAGVSDLIKMGIFTRQTYYETQKRCGCMYCPMSSFINFAYLYKYYPEKFAFMVDKMKETETVREKELGRPFSCISSNPKYNSEYLERIIKTKWVKKLDEIKLDK